MNWKVYNELAWVDEILAGAESYEEEAMAYIKEIKKHISVSSPMMLHLGCGAGGHDFHFKQHFLVTGVDLSEGMLNIAKKTNPEIHYLKGDMRNCRLNRKFDVIVIPDSIMYMSTIEDLTATLKNAVAHMKPEGILLIVAHIKEEFRNNNFAYTAEKENLHITVFENNYIVSDSTYEATMVYLIRREGKLSTHHEVHTLGLFSYGQWMDIFEECQLKVDELNFNHLYDQYILDSEEYKLKLFMLKQVT